MKTQPTSEMEIIRTTNRSFKLMDFSKDDVNIEDIARGLAKENRFNGQYQGDHMVSVAQHSVYIGWWIMQESRFGSTPHPVMKDFISRRAVLEMAMIGHIHDGSEGPLGDMITPMKRHFPEFRKIEDHYQNTIYEYSLGKLPSPKQLEVLKVYDRRMFNMECRELGRPTATPDEGMYWDPHWDGERFSDRLLHTWWDIKEARETFLEFYDIYDKQLREYRFA